MNIIKKKLLTNGRESSSIDISLSSCVVYCICASFHQSFLELKEIEIIVSGLILYKSYTINPLAFELL